MTFLHPWALWLGIAAAAAPVVIHLLTRPRPVRLPISTLRFVREAIRQRRARSRLRDVLVLLLRTAAVLLLAMAIARPQWGEKPLVSDDEGRQAVRVVLLDVSQSMAATSRSVEAIERARTLAAGYLRYRPGLQANLVLGGATPRPVFDGPSTNFEALREELAECRALPERIDVNRALGVAAEMLVPQNENDRRRRELIVVSDFQRANWAAADFAQLPEDTQIQLEPVTAEEPPANLAILRAEARARSARGRRVQLEVDVGNFTPSARQAVVEVAVGEATLRLKATCPSGKTTLSDEVELKDLGWQSGRASLVGVDDALRADDGRALVVCTRPRPVYALVTRQPADERPSSSHYLECALVPDRRLGDDASAELFRVDPEDLSHSVLAPADLIVLDHPGKLSEEGVKLLAGLLRRGRPILYVAGELIDAVNLRRLSDAAGSGLTMPVEFTPPPAGQLRRGLFLASVRAERPPFSVFGDGLRAATAGLRFAGGLSSRQNEGGLEDDLLAAYNDGSACLVMTASDAGALAVINADLAASNLPQSQAFVPLVEELTDRLLSRHRETSDAVCGEQLVAQLPVEAGAVAGLQIVGPGPDAADGTPDRFGRLSDEGAGAVWHWTAPDRPGVYQVRRDGKPVFAMALNVPAEESELEGLPGDVFTERLAGGRKLYFHGAAGAADRRDDAWKWFAVACVVCMLGEVAALLAFRT